MKILLAFVIGCSLALASSQDDNARRSMDETSFSSQAQDEVSSDAGLFEPKNEEDWAVYTTAVSTFFATWFTGLAIGLFFGLKFCRRPDNHCPSCTCKPVRLEKAKKEDENADVRSSEEVRIKFGARGSAEKGEGV